MFKKKKIPVIFAECSCTQSLASGKGSWSQSLWRFGQIRVQLQLQVGAAAIQRIARTSERRTDRRTDQPTDGFAGHKSIKQ